MVFVWDILSENGCSGPHSSIAVEIVRKGWGSRVHSGHKILPAYRKCKSNNCGQDHLSWLPRERLHTFEQGGETVLGRIPPISETLAIAVPTFFSSNMGLCLIEQNMLRSDCSLLQQTHYFCKYSVLILAHQKERNCTPWYLRETLLSLQ